MTDKEMTRLLAEKVMGWPTCGPAAARQRAENNLPAICERVVYAPGGGFIEWHPLRIIDHAWMVRDRLAEWGYVAIEHRYSGIESCLFMAGRRAPEVGAVSCEAYGASATRVICMAALRAIGQEVPDAD